MSILKKITIQDELDFFLIAREALKKIPNDYRSRYHTDYLNELDARCHELFDAIHYVKDCPETEHPPIEDVIT